MPSRSKEVKAGMDSGVRGFNSYNLSLFLQKIIKLFLHILNNRLPTLCIIDCISKARSVYKLLTPNPPLPPGARTPIGASGNFIVFIL